METTPIIPLDPQWLEDTITRTGRQREAALSMAAQHTENLRAYTITALAQGYSEVKVARMAGISRDTLRKWRGKK